MGRFGKEGEAWVRIVIPLRDRTKLASASDDMTVRVWDIATGRTEHKLEGYSSPVNTFI